jgi:hypothetical protein
MTTLTAGQSTYQIWSDGLYREICWKCGGTGNYYINVLTANGHQPKADTCWPCNGSGTTSKGYTAEEIQTMATRRAKAEAYRNKKRQAAWEAKAPEREAAQAAELARLEAIANRKASQQWLDGVIGDKVTITGQIVYTATIDSQYGSSQLIIIKIDDTHKVKMFTTANWAYTVDKDDTVTVTGEIKNFDEYNGEKATQLVREKQIEA